MNKETLRMEQAKANDRAKEATIAYFVAALSIFILGNLPFSIIGFLCKRKSRVKYFERNCSVSNSDLMQK